MGTPEVKARVEAILQREYREVKAMIEHNKEAVTAIAEALILRNELTDLDVAEILSRVEAEHPYRDPRKVEKQPFGFLGAKSLSEPTSISRRSNTGTTTRLPEVNVPPVAKQPPEASAEPQASAEGDKAAE
jgi:cell division protease FtsH